jgi:PIN domain nuclease of toxin-antitoxin system
VIILDTHVLVWAAGGERKLGRRTRAMIDKLWPAGQVSVPAIAFWEIGVLVARGRIKLPLPVREWRNELLIAGVTELPLDGDIALRALDLEGLPHDPADRFIVASALLHGGTLVTADEKLLGWKNGLERQDARL